MSVNPEEFFKLITLMLSNDNEIRQQAEVLFIVYFGGL